MSHKATLCAGAIALLCASLPASAETAFPQSAGGGYATVSAAGALKHGLNVRGVKHAAPGKYLVKFNNDIGKCAAQATIAGQGKRSLLPGYIVVTPRRGLNSVQVATFLTVTLLPADFPFDLTVTCGA